MRRFLFLVFLLPAMAACGQSLWVMTDLIKGPLDTTFLRNSHIRVVTDSIFYDSSYGGIRRYELDVAGRMHRIVQRNQDGAVAYNALLSYDGAGSVQEVELREANPPSDTRYSSQAFRSSGRIDSIVFAPDNSLLIFRYDQKGRLLQKEFTPGTRWLDEKERTLYQYDSLGRISIVERRTVNPDTKPEGYIASLRIFQYSGGRLVEETETIKGSPHFTLIGTVHYKYDAAGRLVEWSEENRKKVLYWYYPDGRLQRARELLLLNEGYGIVTEHRYSYEL